MRGREVPSRSNDWKIQNTTCHSDHKTWPGALQKNQKNTKGRKIDLKAEIEFSMSEAFGLLTKKKVPERISQGELLREQISGAHGGGGGIETEDHV